MQNEKLADLYAAGVSIWIDDLDRHRIESGNLQELIDTKSVVGVTTNPSIFEKAMTSGLAEYQPQLAELASAGASTEEAENGYSAKVIAERERLNSALRQLQSRAVTQQQAQARLLPAAI